MLSTNEGCDGAAFWDTTGVLLGTGMVGTGFVSPVASASLGMSFAVATMDASDMDFGRKGELIGTESFYQSLFHDHQVTNISSGRFGILVYKIFWTIITKYIRDLALGRVFATENFGLNCQEIPHRLHVPIPLLPMGQMGRLGELDPLYFLELIEEGPEAVIVDLVVPSVGQQRPVCDFGDAVDD